MALLQRSRVLSNQRLDLPDYNNIENFVCADFKAQFKNVYSNQNYVMSGFACTGVGTTQLSVALAGSVALFGNDDGNLYIGAPSLSPLATSTLTPSSVNFVELVIDQDTGGADTRAFWDSTANGGVGGEFSQIVDTFIFTKAVFAINDSNFTGDPDKLPICEVVVDGGGSITSIIDRRDMYFRLGKANNTSFDYVWASRVEPVNTQFTGADKDIQNEKQWKDAVMSVIKELAGTNHWYEVPSVSVIGSFNNTALSVLTGITANARFGWSGTQLEITDDDGTPSDSDAVASIRLLAETSDLMLTRQDGVNAITLFDGDVLWIELPDPVAATNYNGVGASSSNYRISPRGSLPINKNTYWLAFREGSKVYLRGLGELEAGEERQVNDETPESLFALLGFNPETASTVPYDYLPNSLIFGNVFSTNDTLVRAISINTANINAIGAALQENAYEEFLDVVSGVAANSYEVQGPVTANTLLTLPLDSRDASTAQEYLVGDGLLAVFLNGIYLRLGTDWDEVGAPNTLSNQIEILMDLEVGDFITFRIDSLGGFNVGTGSGGDVVGASNLGGGEGNVFKQKAAGILELRTLKAGAGISIVTSGDQVIISATGGVATPFFVNYITGQVVQTIGTGGTYNQGTDKLEAYRNGVKMINTTSIGDLIDRYQEATNNTIITDPGFPPISSEVFTFVNLDNDPTSSTLITGQTGTVITVPTYTVGDDSLRIYRNGVLMNTASMGNPVDQYSESSTTTITLSSAATATEVFNVVVGPTLSSREDITGQTGTVLTLSNSYTIGSQRLLVFRNGVLMLNSVSLGSVSDRYSQTSTTSITLASAALASEVFTFIIL